MELKDLTGEHVLDGVDTFVEKIPSWYEGGFEDANCIVFRLDGVAYLAIEDPSDGYRSSMKDIDIIDKPMTNVFPPVRVVGRHKDKSSYYTADILELIDVKTGKTVLEVGTDNSDDYYPSFVASFIPENMVINTDISSPNQAES